MAATPAKCMAFLKLESMKIRYVIKIFKIKIENNSKKKK